MPLLEVLGSFENADAAAKFMTDNAVDLLFLDIQMSSTNGLEFAKSIPKTTLVIFTTAFSQYAADSYEVDAADYLMKPIRPDFIFIKSERKYYKVYFKDILFIEKLKDYVIIQMDSRRVIGLLRKIATGCFIYTRHLIAFADILPFLLTMGHAPLLLMPHLY
ncbi:MAG: response regulator, partial [Cytophagaceae bacterium]|nr:response regulator [Cytophagaceae bacterium]